MSETKPRSPTTDRPPEDLKKERDAFIEQFFRKGAQFSEELIGENKRLREKLAEAEAENAKLRAQLASDSAIRELLTKIEQLEADKQLLMSRSTQMQAVTNDYTKRYNAIEDELANLANLYVATSQIYSGYSVRAVIRTLKELLAQFLGVAAFSVYLVNPEQNHLVAVATEGVTRSDVATIPAGTGPAAEVFKSGRMRIQSEGDTSKGSQEHPAALIPLRLDDYVVGVIAIFATLPQKTEFGHVDHELFKMLSDHAGPALVSARLFTEAGRKLPNVLTFLGAED